VNQSVNNGNGGWVSLGKYHFTQGDTGQKLTLTQNSTGFVIADAVKAVSDTTGVTNTSRHSFTYSYDPTCNQTGIADGSVPAPAIASYAISYDQVNRLSDVNEKNSGGAVQHDTSYTYDAASNLTTRTHDGASSVFEFDPRDLLSTQTDKASGSDTSPQVIQFSEYTPDGLLKT
jgi:hypothetical protein